MRTHPSLAGGRVASQLPEGLTKELAFPAAEYDARVERLREGMAARGIDVLLLMHPASVFYVSGFQSISLHDDTCLILPRDDEPSTVLHPPELGSAMLHSRFDQLIGYRSGTSHAEYLAACLREQGFTRARIGVEDRTAGMPAGIRLELERQLAEAELVDASDVLRDVQRTKSGAEIEHIRAAARVTAAAMRAAIDAAVEGGSDNATAGAAAHGMAAAGGEYPCLWPIVTSGRRSGILHSTHKRAVLARGDSVLIEIGGCYQRYSAPQMRTVSIGEAPAQVRQAADGCLRALDTVLATLRPGLLAHEVAEAGWEALAGAGSKLVFHGNFGYAVGAGFPPSWGDGTGAIERGQHIRLEPGMVFHHPLAVRRLGEFGVAFSETSVITADGCEVLTSGGRELVVR